MNSFYVKAALAFGLLVAALVGGVYLSGFLLPMLLKVHVSTPWYATWWSYYKAIDLPQVAPYAGKIKLATAIGFGLPVLVLLPLAILMFKPSQKALHGDARFANSGDLARKDMFKPSPTGIVVGKFGGKLIRLPGQQFVILAAPTRSGKGVGIVIPNLLDYTESMVVLDIKQENFDLTSGWRASQGQEIYLFNPFAEDRRTHRWNPLTYVSRDPAFRVSDLASIAAMLYPDGADDQKFWVSQARNAFLAFTLYLFENWEEEQELGFPFSNYPTLGAVYRLSSGDGTDLKKFLQGLSTRKFLSGNAKTTFANMLSQAEETFASIMGTFKEPLNAFINPILDAATNADDFLLSDVRKRRMTIYIGIQPNKLAESRLIVNLFFSQLINQNTKELPQNNKALKYQCLLLMDEFTSIGKVEIIATAIAYMAGYNIRLLPIIQSMAQLDAVYGKDVSRTMITNHALQIVYAPREQQDANDYSEMLGYTTVRKRNRSRSYGQQGNYTLSENEERRALMLPQELKAMGNDREVFFYEGIPHPVLCEKIKYFKDKHFTSRLLPRVKIKTLQIGDGRMPNKVQDTVSAMAMLALTACAVQPVANQTAQAAPQEISQTAQTALSASAAPANPAEALGQKLLTLIDSLKTIEDLTPERVNKVMQVELVEEPKIKGWYEYEKNISEDWYYTFYYREANKHGSASLDININPRNKSKQAAMTPACLEFNGFSDQLAARGYERKGHVPIESQDPEPTSWDFWRPMSNGETGGDPYNPYWGPSGGKGAVDIKIRSVVDEFTDEMSRGSGRKCIDSIDIGNYELLP